MKQVMTLAVPPILVGLLMCCYCTEFGSERFRARLISQMSASAYSAPSPEPLLSQVIEQERRKWNLPKGLIEAVITVESNWNEHAYNPETNSSCARRGRKDCASAGLMGLVSRWHGKCATRDYACQIRKGAKHLGEGYRATGTVWATACRYNGVGKAAEIYANKVIREFEIWKRLG